MKICYLADANSIHTQRWVKYFAERGHDVHLISYNPAHINGVKIYGFTKYGSGESYYRFHAIFKGVNN